MLYMVFLLYTKSFAAFITREANARIACNWHSFSHYLDVVLADQFIKIIQNMKR